MNTLIAKRLVNLLWALPLLLSISACKAAQVAPVVAVTATTTADVEEGTAEPAGDPSTEDVVFGAGPFTLIDPAAGLADLSAYQATLTLSFDGTEVGEASQWSRTYVMSVSQTPAMRQLTVEGTGDVSEPGSLFMAELDGTLYEQQGEGSCTASAVAEGNSLTPTWEPVSFFGGVIGADEAGSETINGVEAAHYTFDEQALGQAGAASSTGELWVASDGGYIVKYLLETEGGADYFGEGSEGTLVWNYEVNSTGQPFTVELPADCPAAMVNAPLLPDADDVSRTSGLTAYTTSSTLAEASAFYAEQLPALGWQPLAEPAILENNATQNFTQGEQTLRVFLLTGEGVTGVYLSVAPTMTVDAAAPLP